MTMEEIMIKKFIDGDFDFLINVGGFAIIITVAIVTAVWIVLNIID